MQEPEVQRFMQEPKAQRSRGARRSAFPVVIAMILGLASLFAPPASAAARSRKRHTAKHGRCVTAKSKRKAHAAASRAAPAHRAKPRKSLGQCRAAHHPTKKAPLTSPAPSVSPSLSPGPEPLAIALPATLPVESLLPIAAAPVSTAPPVIAGTAAEQQVLEAQAGSWTGSPTSYAYQWQDCDALGEGCANVSGATAPSELLGAGDVGHTIRVVVTASNAGGSAVASSAPTALVTESSTPLLGSASVEPSGDTDSAGLAEAFAYTAPASGVVQSLALYVNSGNSAPEIEVGLYSDVSGHPGELLTGATISSPTAGAWNVVGVPSLAVTAGSVYWLAALAPSGTLALRDVPDGGGPTQNSGSASLSELPSSWSSGASWANSPASFYASAEVWSPPSAPTNTALPAISGNAVEGNTLSASVGAWTGSPTSYEYQWNVCDTAGEACSSVGGATASSYKLVAADVGHTLRAVVTARNAFGSARVTSAATATVAAEAPPAPSNTVAPSIEGSAVEGQTLTVDPGTWAGSPTSYAYQWEDCNATGKACSAVAGATSSRYTLVGGDVGHELRAVVTARNAGGSTPASSAATAQVTGTGDTACGVTVSPGVGVGVIAGDVVSAADGSTVCLAGGSYPSIHIEGAVHGSYVTVRPVAGATATVAGIEVADSSFLRFQGLHMTQGFNMRDGSASASHDYQFVDNTFEEPHYGVVLYGGSAPIKKVLIEGNHFNHVVFTEQIGEGRVGECHAGYAEGAGVTLFYAEGVTIAHNTFDEVDVHYIQGGSSGPEGAVVEHNLFEGYTHYECVHLNLWQIWSGGENDTFRDNIAIGKGTKGGVGPFKNGDEEAATDGVLFENGAGSSECGVRMKNSVIENNLFVDAGDSYELQVYTTEGATIRDNTVVGSAYGTALLTEACGAGSDYTMTHNIDVQNGSGSDFGFGSCSGTCSFDYNVSQDASAQSNGATHYVTGWSPKWTTTTWNPATEPTAPPGFYIPTGLPIEAGYQGNAGP